jgi:uncharacterized membrane protein YgdD (TMEM256/DUF423 family)
MAALGVLLGAFGAHGLEDRLGPDSLAVFIVVAWAWTRWRNAWTDAAGWFFIFGIILFSGSLYLLAITGVRWLGAITPLGGVAFIAGWVALAVAPLRAKS